MPLRLHRKMHERKTKRKDEKYLFHNKDSNRLTKIRNRTGLCCKLLKIKSYPVRFRVAFYIL
jgi:hypothetical protein